MCACKFTVSQNGLHSDILVLRAYRVTTSYTHMTIQKLQTRFMTCDFCFIYQWPYVLKMRMNINCLCQSERTRKVFLLANTIRQIKQIRHVKATDKRYLLLI